MYALKVIAIVWCSVAVTTFTLSAFVAVRKYFWDRSGNSGRYKHWTEE